MAPDLGPWDAVDRLRGIGPALSAGLAEVGVTRVVDLLLHLPHRYENRTQLAALDGSLTADRWVLVRGRVAAVSARRAARRRMRIVSGLLSDGRGTLPVVWFNQPWVEDRLRRGASDLSLYGPVRRGRDGRLQLVNPEVNDVVEGGDERIVPVYPTLGPLGGRRLRRLIVQCLEAAELCPDPLPEELRSQLGLPGLAEAVRQLHEPLPAPTEAATARLVDELCRRASPAHRRLAFDELLAFACGLASHRASRHRRQAPRCRSRQSLRTLARRLVPFELTAAQWRVAAEIERDLGQRVPMARLIQGDVGSGKTVVAALAMLLAVEGGHQAALMVPTELLAEQHARTLTRMFAGTSNAVHLLSSSQPSAGQQEVRRGLADGTVRLVVGTHALVQESVEFSDLALAVVDEQHRFGVVHRQALVGKGSAPHLLVMTATPIPRSLALTVYGDLDLSVIDELPPGRMPVTTVVRSDADKPRLYAFLRRELADGGRAYLVYPAIEANDEGALPSLAEHVEEVRRALPGVALGVLHGRMSRAEQEEVYQRFAEGTVQALLATTVVEVGVDVGEASVMVVEGAHRFGLSQLHQLRGRVGRGSRKAWCVLLADDAASEEARRRLDVVCGTADGFLVAEADLEFRGPGELTGTRQWGPGGFRFADLVRHGELVVAAQDAARKLADSGELTAVGRELGRYHPVEVGALPAG